MSDVIPSGGKKVRCPQCRKIAAYNLSNPFRPFCGERCKLIDLGAWANDDYVIAGSKLEAPLSVDGDPVPVLQPVAGQMLQ